MLMGRLACVALQVSPKSLPVHERDASSSLRLSLAADLKGNSKILLIHIVLLDDMQSAIHLNFAVIALMCHYGERHTMDWAIAWTDQHSRRVILCRFPAYVAILLNALLDVDSFVDGLVEKQLSHLAQTEDTQIILNTLVYGRNWKLYTHKGIAGVYHHTFAILVHATRTFMFVWPTHERFLICLCHQRNLCVRFLAVLLQLGYERLCRENNSGVDKKISVRFIGSRAPNFS